MSFSELMRLLKNVIIAPEVIFIGILLFLYLKLVFYVIRYRKQTLSVESRIRRNLKKPVQSETNTETPAAEA